MSLQPPRPGLHSERGATVVIVAMLMVAMLICAAFAVDFGSWYARAEKLQNAADAAALAGAVSYSQDGDESAAADHASEILRQNGVDSNDGDINIAITFPSSTEVAVEVLDTDVALFFSRIIRTDAMNIQRDAIARQDRCAATCAQTIPIPRPLSEIDITGSGDGFTPILIGRRVYAINHHIWGDIVCVDLDAEEICSNYPQPVQRNQRVQTENIVHTAVVGTKIFYAGQWDQSFLACFDVSTEAPCNNSPATVTNLPRNTGHSGQQSRVSATILVNDRIYLFSDDNRVHCYLPTDMSRCSGYPLSDGLAAAGVPQRTGRDDTASMSDRIADDAGKIYVATHYSRGPYASYGVLLHCWDTVRIEPCNGFQTNRILTDSNAWLTGRLFFNRNSSGTITGVCATDVSSHACVDLSGNATGQIPGLDATMDAETGFRGTHLYHEPSNRQILNGGLFTSLTYCWDFNTGSSCGRIKGNNTEDYGYAYRGNCIYSLGDNSIFWTFDISMTPGCREGTAETSIRPCVCSTGERHWGSVRFIGDDNLLSPTGPFEAFDVTIFDPNDHGIVLFSDSMLGSSGELDLSAIPTSYDSLDVEVFVRMKLGEDPWADGTPPQVEVGWTDKPHLID